jgi:CRISPR system Cascade subunit CasE
MYLSRLLLNPRSRQVQRETADPYQLHRTIMNAFDPRRTEAGVLHRLDTDPRSGNPTLLVQSQLRPDWHFLDDKEYLLPPDPFSEWDNPAVKTFDLPLQPGQILHFRLRANPTIKKVRRNEAGERLNSNRVPLVHEEKQAEWLAERAIDSGFHLQHLHISQAQKQTSRKKGNGRPITLYTVQYNGRLQVTDPDKLLTAVRTGIGPAKAFGCGLLSLAPA